jgi:hypothetical protein
MLLANQQVARRQKSSPDYRGMEPTLARPSSARIGFFLLLGLLILCAVGKTILADTLDPDAFWHLRVGEEISHLNWSNWTPSPLVDDLSFASIREPWTPYSWLAELGMWRLWDFGGYRAAIAVQAILEGLFVTFLALSALETTRRAWGQPRYLSSILATTVGAFFSLPFLSFRPVTAALTGLAFIAWILLRDRRMQQKSIAVWLVPPITAIIVNLHFFAVLCPLWLFALLVGDLIENRFEDAGKKIWRDVCLLALSTLACLCTPYLNGTIQTMLHYTLNDVMVRSPLIAEMQPIYHGIAGVVTIEVAAGIVLLAIARHRQAGIGEILWLLGSATLLVSAGRFSPVFAIIATPLLAATMPAMSDRSLARPVVGGVLLLVLVAGVWRITESFPSHSTSISTWLNRNGPDVPHYPCAAADFVEQNIHPATGRVICEYSWGGYLEWRLAHRFQPLMDGRTQLFSTDFWNAAYFSGESARQEFLASTHADAAVLPLKGPFQESLKSLGWKIAFKDDFAQVLIPPSNP